MNIFSKVFNFILNFIWKIFLGIGVIFAAISILINFLFVPRLFMELSHKFPYFFKNVLFSWKTTIFLSVLLIVFVGGVFAWQYFAGREEAEEIGTQEMASGADISSWQTYRNEEYGFEFKYPSDHTVYMGVDQEKPLLIPATAQSDNVSIATREAMVFCCEPTVLSFSVKVTTKTAREWAEEFLKSIPEWGPELPPVEDSTLAGKPAVEAKGPGGYNPPYRLIVSPLDGLLLVIIQDGNDPLLNQILSTSRFIEETAGRKVYRNEEYGFEIKYPQGFSIVPSSRETISPDSESVPSLAMYFAANEWLGQQLNYPTIGITVSRTNLSAKQWIEENFLVGVEPGQYEPYHGRSKEITETTIGNYPALQFDYFFASGHSQHTVFWNKDTIVSLSNNVTGLGDYEEVYNQMFSTFKFL